MVATRDIKPGEILLKEQPLISGPSQNTVPVCVGCYKNVDEKSRCCSKCGWPICSEICEKAPQHIPECRYSVMRGDKVSIKNFNMIHPTYQCVTVLRCLYQKQFLPETWKKIDELQSHCEERKDTQKYEQERVNIAQFIRKFFKLESVFTEEEILKVCGIVMINSHEIPLTDTPYIALYDQASLLEHNCSPNCSKSFTDKGYILISAGKPIKKDEHISICYTDPLWGTPNRRQHLWDSKYFWCECHRCKDKTEFGTYFSALRCQDSNCTGFLLPETFIENSMNEKGSDWKCNACKAKLSTYSVHDLLERIGKDLSEMPKGVIRECRSFIETYEQLLHPNHYYLTDVKLALANMIGQEEGGLVETSSEDFDLKLKLCRDLMSLTEKLIPGERRVRGVLLFELHACMAEIARRNTDDPEIVKSALMDSKKFLTECIELLKHEPEALPEGKIYKQALQNMQEFAVLKE
ncbi:unnamed protein product [Acanthoscelides obtectus]|nr:unnamed protein product [Acanthoscelides obtectus]CAK1675042.1 Protein msta, isoform A [Acanthoscelides obtectus]